MISTNLSITNTQWPSPMGLQPTPPSSTSAVGSEVNQLLNATTQLTTSMQDTALQNKQAQDQKDRDQALKRQQTSLLATLPPPASINTTAQAPTPPTAPSLPFTPGSAVMPTSTQAPVAKADPPINIGDSIARGIEGAQGNGLDTDPQQVGRTPQGVFKYLIGKGPAYFNGKTVQLSSGILNDTNAIATVEKGLKFLKEAGAKVSLVGVPENNPKFASLNNQLEKLAKVYGATWLGGYKAGSDGVHPSSYASLKTQFAISSAQAPTLPTAPSLPFTSGNAVMPASPAPAPAPAMTASANVSTVDGIKNFVSNAWTQASQLIASGAQSVAQVVTGAPAQAGTLPPNALATASPLPTMMNSTGGLIHPLAGKGTNTSGFGMRNHPTKGGQRMHTGQDVGAPEGTPIVAAAGGKVVKNANDTGGYGNYVVIEHTSGEQKIETLYGHMKAPSPLQVGASVQQGQQIGLVGSTGASTGPHLHFEVIVNGKPQDPMAYLPKGGTQKA